MKRAKKIVIFPFPLACGSCFIALTKKEVQDTNVCIRWRIVALFIFQHEVKCNEVSLCLFADKF